MKNHSKRETDGTLFSEMVPGFVRAHGRSNLFRLVFVGEGKETFILIANLVESLS